MLRRLSIRDVVLIERLDMDFAAGLSVLTGETGAGKSILLDALGLVLGARADAGLIRAGAPQAVVTAEFEPPSATTAILDGILGEHGIATESPITLRRVLGGDGRNRAFVNDQPASATLLRRLGASLIEIQGQHAAHGLLDPSTHGPALDAFGGLEETVAATRMAHGAWRAAVRRLQEARQSLEAAQRDEEFLRHALEEIDALGPEPGEDLALAERRGQLQHHERVVEALREAAAELSGGRGVAGALRNAQRALERAASQAGGRLDECLTALDRAAVEVSEAQNAITAANREMDHDTDTLEQVEERLFALRALARKHQTTPEMLPALRESFAARVAALDAEGAGIAGLEQAATTARGEYRRLAGQLSEARRRAATRLDATITAELPPLKLEKAGFHTRIETLAEPEWGPGGTDRIAFEITTNPGTEPGSLARIASGGELSRFLLALKVALARVSSVPTLIFDEVDSGIGGATAAAVGARLRRLAGDLQVLVVTHSPQVAARGTHHWRVAKREAGGQVVTEVEALDGGAHREEIARMLSGSTITGAARAAADSLIAGVEA